MLFTGGPYLFSVLVHITKHVPVCDLVWVSQNPKCDLVWVAEKSCFIGHECVSTSAVLHCCRWGSCQFRDRDLRDRNIEWGILRIHHSSFAITCDGRLHDYNISYQHQKEAHFVSFGGADCASNYETVCSSLPSMPATALCSILKAVFICFIYFWPFSRGELFGSNKIKSIPQKTLLSKNN